MLCRSVRYIPARSSSARSTSVSKLQSWHSQITFAQYCRNRTLESSTAVETILDRPLRLEQVPQLRRRNPEPQLRNERVHARLQLSRDESKALDRKQEQRFQCPDHTSSATLSPPEERRSSPELERRIRLSHEPQDLFQRIDELLRLLLRDEGVLGIRTDDDKSVVRDDGAEDGRDD